MRQSPLLEAPFQNQSIPAITPSFIIRLRGLRSTEAEAASTKCNEHIIGEVLS